MVVTNDDRLAERCRYFKNLCFPLAGLRNYIHEDIGFNYRMTNLEASLGLAQLERLSGYIEKKRRFREIYIEGMKGLPVCLQEECPKAESSFWLNALTFENEKSRKKVEKALKSAGVPFRRLFAPVPESPPYCWADKKCLGTTYDIYNRGLCLPSSVANTRENIRVVCAQIQKVFA